MRMLYLEAALYTGIAVGTPIGELLVSDRPLSGRTVAAVSVLSVVAGFNALKAFLSTSYSRATGDAILVRDSSVTGRADVAAPAPPAVVNVDV